MGETHGDYRIDRIQYKAKLLFIKTPTEINLWEFLIVDSSRNPYI
jgi:hypothetical protein